MIAGSLKETGLTVDVFEPSLDALWKHPAFVEVSRGYEGRPNVVGILQGVGGRKVSALERPCGRNPGGCAGKRAARQLVR
ncbi:hypothetical protein SAMN05660649_01771 [Desulfotomaculum arcticum]|uniref:Uncharacterized protein n=1 Tax=Desulfotruncus arcticus DSM 17038 TaxID=1121424 RepID=A0A1I2SCY5_9FIRM|nr:hypothetical protein SAMN05660649_01771 [Desulfotomaculum arcticum] [Desulfotruncus arcticus DSM 17038]